MSLILRQVMVSKISLCILLKRKMKIMHSKTNQKLNLTFQLQRMLSLNHIPSLTKTQRLKNLESKIINEV